MLPTLQIGPLAIQLPGLILLIGLWLGLTLAEKHAQPHGILPNQVYAITFTALFASIVAARVVYVLRNASAFSHSLSDLFSLNPALLDAWGACLGVCLVSIYAIKRHRLNPWSFLDAFTPVLAVLMLATSFSNLASGKGFGTPTNLPWAIYLFGEWRHPTQIYESIAALAALVIFWPGSLRAKFSAPGVYALSVIAATAGLRLFFETWRGDSVIISGGFRGAQLIAWLILALSLWLITHRTRQPTSVPDTFSKPNT